jgi:hypothetical protein
MLKWLLVGAAALLALGVLALAAIPWLVDAPRVQAYIAHAASQALGRPVRFASLRVTGLPWPSVKLSGLEVAEDPRFGATPFLTVSEGRIGLRLRPLLAGRVELADVTLKGLRLSLIEDDGRLNLASLGPPTPSGRTVARPGAPPSGGGAVSAVAVSRLHVVDGAVDYHRRGERGPGFRLERINVTIAPAGRPDMLGLAGEAVGQPGAARIRVSNATLTPAAGRPLGEAAVKAAVEVEVDDVGALSSVVLASPHVAGPLKGTVQLGGTASRLTGTGDVQMRRLVVSQTRPVCPPPASRQLVIDDLRMPLALTPARLDSVPLHARAGGGAVSVKVAVSWQSTPVLALSDITVKGMELEPVLAGYLCQSYAVSGPLDLTGSAALQTADPWRTVNGEGRFKVGRGKVVGGGVLALLNEVARVSSGLAVLSPDGRRSLMAAPLDFDSITATYRIVNGVFRTDDLVYDSPRARIVGAGIYRLLDGRVDMAVTVAQGRTELRARVTGTPGAVHVVPTGVSAGDPGGVRRMLDRLLR